jgi:hypothetical protein
MSKENELDEVERYILNTIKDVNFGSVEVTIHNSRIVQVEKSEKRRFETRQPA